MRSAIGPLSTTERPYTSGIIVSKMPSCVFVQPKLFDSSDIVAAKLYRVM